MYLYILHNTWHFNLTVHFQNWSLQLFIFWSSQILDSLLSHSHPNWEDLKMKSQIPPQVWNLSTVTSQHEKYHEFLKTNLCADLDNYTFTEVTDDQKISSGGGLLEEGEMIEVIEMSIDEIKSYLDQNELKTNGRSLTGLYWFLARKASCL